jgi:glucokinase
MLELEKRRGLRMSSDSSVAVGLVVEGRQTTVALVDRCGRVVRRCFAKTLQGRPPLATLDPYLRAIDALLCYARDNALQVRGIGVSVPGSLDDTRRHPLIVPVLPSLNGFPLYDLFRARYDLPIELHVDVDAALVGEQRLGAGRGVARTLYLRTNAVVGASLIVDGEVQRIRESYLGHICHIAVATTMNGSRCSCGKRGCINTLVSADALQKMVQRAQRRGEESNLMQRLLKQERFSSELLAEEAVLGDGLALRVYDEMGRWLSAAITKYIDLFEPDLFILGGGIISTSDLLLSRVYGTLERAATSRVCSMVKVVPALLGADATLPGTVLTFL